MALTKPKAEQIEFIPSGGLSATNLQAALNELDSDKTNTANLAAPSGSSLVGYDGGTVQDMLDAVTGPTGAASVGYTPAGTGAVATTVQDELRKMQGFVVNVKNAPFYAKGNGIDDDTAAITAAITATVDVYFPPGTYKCGAITFPARNVNLFSDGATIQGTSGTFIFKQRNRGYLTSLSGLIFTGNATAFDYDSDDASLPNGGQYYEYRIESCHFLQAAAAVHAIRLYGAREGLISSCYFQDNKGIYTEFAINTVVSDCQFKNCSYMVLSKLGSEGLIVSNAVALGCSFGIRCERTTGFQLVNSMIDYCDAPVYLKGATDVLISNNYISTRTAAPAVHAVKYNDGFRGYNHAIKGNNIRDNHSTTGSACVRYEETDFFNISDNILANYASYGIVYTSCTQGDIARNIVRNRTAAGTNSILSLTDSDTIRIYHNRFVQALSRTNNTSTWENSGFATEASGEAIIANGNSSVAVNHGLAITPNKVNISLTPTTPNTQGIDYYVSATTASTFTVTTGSPVGSTTAFAWQARSKP